MAYCAAPLPSAGVTKTSKLAIAALGSVVVVAAIIVVAVLALRPAPATTPKAQASTPAAPAASFTPAAAAKSWGHGLYKVGVDIQPGSYKTAGDTSECYWNRLKDDSGKSSAIIARAFVTGPGQMTIDPADAFVKFGGPCKWTNA